MGRHVAGRARVGVLAPGAADVVGLLEDGEGIDAGLLEVHAHGDAGEAGADDHDRKVARCQISVLHDADTIIGE